MKKTVFVSTLAVLLFLFSAVLHAHLCDNVFRQANALIVKPEFASLVVKDRSTFKIFLQNNMDRGIAEISLIPESTAFEFEVTPAKMSIPKDRQVYFQVTLTPKSSIRTGNYTVKFRLVGGGREFKSFTLEGLAREKTADNVNMKGLSQIRPVSEGPLLDGNLNDPCWRNAVVLSNFRSPSGPEPAYKTWVLITFDRNNLYLGIMGRDESTQKLMPSDRMEIILSPGKSDSSGFFMTFSPAGTPQYKRYDRQSSYNWQPAGIKYETAKRAADWSMEIALPLSAIETPYPAEKSLWEIRFTRIKESGLKETSFWANDTTGYHSEKGLGKIIVMP